MVQIISGTNGMGKSSYLLDSANTAIKTAHGDIVYIDKSSNKMHDLSTRIRLIDMSQYSVKNYDNFIGFIYGMISQNYDLETIYLDNFLKLSRVTEDGLEKAFADVDHISKAYHIDFFLGVTLDADKLPPLPETVKVIAL